MKLLINGQAKKLTGASPGLNLGGVVDALCANRKHILAELNGRIVAVADWKKTPVKEGDKIELVAFVGGG